MARFLVGHELDQETIAGGEASSREIQLNPFLVETEEDGLVVEIGLNTVDGLSTVSTEATSWLVRDSPGVV